MDVVEMANVVTAIFTAMTALVTALVGWAAWRVAAQNARIAQATVVPLLHIRAHFLRERIEIAVVNWGLGPAKVKEVRVSYPEEPSILEACQRLVAETVPQGTAVDVEQPHQLRDAAKKDRRDVVEKQLVAADLLPASWRDYYGQEFEPIKNPHLQPGSKSGTPTAQKQESVVLKKHPGWIIPPPRRSTAAIDYRNETLTDISKCVVGTTNVAEGDFRLLYAAPVGDLKLLRTRSAQVLPNAEVEAWDKFRLSVMGLLDKVKLEIDYVGAVGGEMVTMRHEFNVRPTEDALYIRQDLDLLKHILNVN
jgi:hypothetical protein